jgi:hypothetical protein
MMKGEHPADARLLLAKRTIKKDNEVGNGRLQEQQEGWPVISDFNKVMLA